MCGGPEHPHNDLRRESQPSIASNGNGHGLNDLIGRKNAPLRLNAKCRWPNKLQLPSPNSPPLLHQHGHHLHLRAISHRHIRPNTNPQSFAISTALQPDSDSLPYSVHGPPPAPLRAGIVQPIQILRSTNVSRNGSKQSSTSINEE